jgi:hypothetical protein
MACYLGLHLQVTALPGGVTAIGFMTALSGTVITRWRSAVALRTAGVPRSACSFFAASDAFTAPVISIVGGGEASKAISGSNELNFINVGLTLFVGVLSELHSDIDRKINLPRKATGSHIYAIGS